MPTKRILHFTLLLLLLALAPISAALAQTGKVALVVGNSEYAHAPRLANPSADAEAIAGALSRIGFAVQQQRDLSVDGLRQALRRFAADAAKADVALVYYAGHGIEVSGSNYLIPVDASLSSDLDIDYELVPVDLVMRSIAGARTLRIVLLDACRDNPFSPQITSGAGQQRSIGRGLGRVDTSLSNTIVAYAAAAGATAADGDIHSPFAAALLKHIETPGLEVRLLLGRVRDSVLDQTRQRQEPFVYSSLGGREFYLGSSAAAPQPAPPQSDQAELLFWQSVKDTSSEAILQTYLQRYPSGTFAALAQARIAELRRLASLPPATKPTVEPKPTPPPIDTPILLGVAGPITGPNAAFGAQMKTGAEQAVADINAAGGILGRRVQLMVEDDVSDPRQGVSVANKFVREGVKFVVGHFNSGVTFSASDVYAANSILMITPSSTNPRVTEKGLWNVFRTCGRDDQQGKLWSDYAVANFRGKKIAIVHDRTTYGQGLADAARGFMNKAGIKEVMYEGVNTGEKDYSALVSKIKSSGADILMWGGLHTEGGLIVRQMRDQGLKTVMMSGDGIIDDKFATIGGEGVIGTLMSFGPDPRTNPAATDVVAKFRAKNFEPQAYTLYSYAAVQILKQAAERVGALDPKQMADAMHSGITFKTVLGDIAFDRKGDRLSLDYVMYTWKRSAQGKITYFQN
jgi:branched-chain amino acid transport system substrate-binding protein